jgi:hypothetical protein
LACDGLKLIIHVMPHFGNNTFFIVADFRSDITSPPASGDMLSYYPGSIIHLLLVGPIYFRLRHSRVREWYPLNSRVILLHRYFDAMAPAKAQLDSASSCRISQVTRVLVKEKAASRRRSPV